MPYPLGFGQGGSAIPEVSLSSFTRTRLSAVTLIPLIGLGLIVLPGASSGAAAPMVSPGAPMQVAPAPSPGSPAAAAMSNGTVQSSNWSGYAASGSTYTSVFASWVEPAVTCSSPTTSVAGFWVGLDGYKDSRVEQTGTVAECYNGTPEYGAWYEMYPAGSVYYAQVVKPGDVINASVAATSPTTFVLKIRDVTEGWIRSTTQTASTPPARSSAEVITEAPCCTSTAALYPLADFGTTSYTKAHVDGLGLAKSTPTRINMEQGSVLKDTTSVLTNGMAFTDTWDHS
jgi:hypothetical protein